MRSYSSREVIKMLKADGWYHIPIKTLKRIEEQSELKFR